MAFSKMVDPIASPAASPICINIIHNRINKEDYLHSEIKYKNNL